jgi:hypothetical protein
VLYDKPLVAGALGAISTIPYEIFTRLLLAAGVGKYGVFELTSLIITLNRPTFLLGAVMTFIVGGYCALIFYYSLKKLGPDHLTIKSICFSLLVWIIMEIFFVWLIEGPKLISPRPIDDYYLHMFGSSLFGLTQGILFKRYLFTAKG